MESVITFLMTPIVGLVPVRLSDIFQTCKLVLSYISFTFYKLLKKERLGFYDVTVKGQPERVGYLTHPVEKELESPRSESHLAKADDGILFYGVNTKGDFLIVSIFRQCCQKAEATVRLRLASGQIYELVKKSDFQQSSANKNAFTCGGLQAYYLKPMRTWRIFYSGYLKETSQENLVPERMAYVKFSLLWRASSDVYDSTSDLNKAEVVKSVAEEDWGNITPPTHKLFNILDFYGQAGVIMGTIFIDEASESQEVYLFGGRLRFLGDVPVSSEIEFCHTFGYVPKNGLNLHFGQASIKNIAKDVKYGFVIKPNGNMRKLQKLDVSVKSDSHSKNAEEMKATIYADRKYMFCGSVLDPTILSENKEKFMSINQINFFVDGKKGHGILLQGKYSLSSTRKHSTVEIPLKLPECVYPMVVAFTEDLCQLPEITGGKGSSLGKLTSLSRELQTFTVPTGIVVTTASYKTFITPDVLDEIKHLEDILYGNKNGDAKEASKRACEKIIASKLPNSVIENIVKNLQKLYGDKLNSIRFAVRSSATGEDTEQMSAAGQMDTLLGIKGLKNILFAVKKCWASQFGFIAIQYKRRYGQCLNTPMAVVVQEMVACDVAGVIFTCDPVTGNGSKMSIAANYGLGESVVSATVDPDTIVLARDENDEMKIHSINAGSKSQKIVMNDEGTISEEIPEELRKDSCLSTEDIFRLGNLAIKIEKYYKSKRDIEWGFKNNTLFLFQSRPVTSGTEETDFEIEHEFDQILRIENEYFSVSNAAEVLPGAMAYLSRDVFSKLLALAWQGQSDSQLQSGVKARYFDLNWFTMYNHLMMSVTDLFYQSKPGKRTALERAVMVSFFGRVLDNEEIFEISHERHSEVGKPFLKSIYAHFQAMLFSRSHLKKTQKLYANYRIFFEKHQTAKDLFDGLLPHCADGVKALSNHLICTHGSMLWNMLILRTLSQDKEEMGSDVYANFSKLVTSKGNVESADVPAAIEELALDIMESIPPEKFKAMKIEEAVHWLNKTPTVAGKTFSQFLKNHGHRGVREFDIYKATWSSDPKPLVQILQNLVGNISKESIGKQNKNIFKKISELTVPIGLFSKLKLLFYVPLSRASVENREAAKSVLIKVLDQWRKACWKLANLMVSEGRIPDEKILFFMTLDEIKDFLESRSPQILAKAYHRQRLYPKMDKYQFPEIMRGIPRPINENEDDHIVVNGQLSMQGIPVSPGVAKGFLRVATTVDEAASLKPGEILLAYSTDIGWSPYFPSLAGVATELGGLISHGAVVSREYGLPCVVSLHGATRKFRTGDYVLIDGNKGLIQKIPPPLEK